MAKSEMKDLNYFPMDVESNIYGMTTLEFDDRSSKVLVATLDCRIYCISYSRFKPHTREVEFTYIPNGAKIMSIGALRRGPDDFVIGITHSLAPNVQKSSGVRTSTSFSSRESGDYGRSTTYYLNIYASGSASSSFDLDYVAQGCQTIRLRYVPYHLHQTEVISFVEPRSTQVERKPFWLLSGGDNAIHAFCEDRPYQSFTEVPIKECFPELGDIGGLALWIDIMNFRGLQESYERVVALGFEDGSVKLYHSVLTLGGNKFELIRESCFDEYTTITPSVRFFRAKSTGPSRLKNLLRSETPSQERSMEECTEQLNLLVVSSTNPSIVFNNVLELGLDERQDLPDSQRLDCSITSAINDTNFDGYNELIIGTHGRELLTYQYNTKLNLYQLAQLSELNHPIFAISVLDLTGDALKEVVILLTSGVLVMQASVKDVLHIVRRRLDVFLSSIEDL